MKYYYLLILSLITCNVVKPVEIPTILKSLLGITSTRTNNTPFEIIGNLPDKDSIEAYLNSKIYIFTNKVLSTNNSNDVLQITNSSGENITGTISFSSRFIIFKPTSLLSSQQRYRVKVSRNLVNTSGETLNTDYSFQFITGLTSLSIPPVPVNLISNSSLLFSSSFAIQFSNPINPSSASDKITVTTASGEIISGSLNSSGNFVYFTPSSNLISGSNYLINIQSALEDIAGNLSITSYRIQFTFGNDSQNSAIITNVSTSNLPFKTGQTIIYITGDDGQYQIGRFKTYTDNNNGTIVENFSGLIWQKCSRGQNNDSTCSGSNSTTNWSNASTYCSTLSLGGKSWRLPNINEIANLLDYSKNITPFINTNFFPNTVSGYYNTSNTYSPNTSEAWNFSFGIGSSLSDIKTSNYSVRCVSGNVISETSNFNDNLDSTIFDNRTGLYWQKCTVGLSGSTCSIGSASGLNWINSVNHCNTLNLAGRTWRLPNINELRTILDLTKSSSPLINNTFFPNTPLSDFWSATTVASNTTSAWKLFFDTGYISGFNKGSNFNVRCVSGP